MLPTPTRSPTAKRVTSAPTAATVPAISCPGTSGYIVLPRVLRAWSMSEWQMPAKAMSMSTSVGPGSRRSIVVAWNPSVGPQVQRAWTEITGARDRWR